MSLIESLLEAVPDGMVVRDQLGAIVMLNHSVEEMFGYATHELLGQPLEKLVPHRYDLAQLLPFALELDSPVQLHGVRHDATEFAMEVRASFLEAEPGRLLAIAMRDVSERKRNEQALHEENRNKWQFLAKLSRDLRTPLTGIMGFSQLLHNRQTGELTALQRDYLSEITASGKQLLQVTDEILERFRIEALPPASAPTHAIGTLAHRHNEAL